MRILAREDHVLISPGAFFAVLGAPTGQQVWAICKSTHDLIYVGLGRDH
jgi:hypothetical protein